MAVSCVAEGVPDAGIAFPELWNHGDPEKEVTSCILGALKALKLALLI